MELRILGGFALVEGDQVIRKLRTRKTEELLAWLALHPQRHARPDLIELLWPDEAPADLRPRLRLALHSIREAIGERLEIEGDLVRVVNLPVDIQTGTSQQIASGLRLMPEHRCEWLDEFHATLLTGRQLDYLRQVQPTSQIEEAGEGSEAPQTESKLHFLIRTDPLEPRWYLFLFRLYMQRGARSAARLVAEAAKAVLQNECPAELSSLALTRSRAGFVGRLQEMAEVSNEVASHSEPAILYVQAMGGMGKSELARKILEIAEQDEITPIWLDMTGVSGAAERDELLVKQLAAKHDLDLPLEPNEIPSTLVVLDDIGDTTFQETPLLRSLLSNASGLRVLMTGRIEQSVWKTYRLSGLGLPLNASIEALEASETGELLLSFLDQARVREKDAPALYEICHLSGGIPLAVRHMGRALQQAPAIEVAESFRKSIGRSTSSEPLSETLRFAYDRLSDSLRDALHRLSIFKGKFTLPSAKMVGVDLEAIERLTDGQWIRREHSSRDAQLLDPVREFLWSRQDPAEDLLESWRAWLVSEIDDHYESDFSRIVHLALAHRLDLADAMTWAENGAKVSGDPTAYRVILAGLYRVAGESGNTSRARLQLADACRLHAEPTHAELRLWNQLASVAYFEGDYDEARLWYQALVDHGDLEWQGVGLTNLALASQSEGDYASGAELIQRSIDMTSVPRRKWTRMLNLTNPMTHLGEWEAVERICDQLLEEAEGAPDFQDNLTLVYLRRGINAGLQGRVEDAERRLLVALDFFEQTRNAFHRGDAYGHLAVNAARSGRAELAAERLQQAVEARRNLYSSLVYAVVVAHLLNREDQARLLLPCVQLKRASPYALNLLTTFKNLFSEVAAPSTAIPSSESFALLKAVVKRL